MKMKRVLWLSAVILTVSLSSCSKNLVPFTANLYEKSNWGENEIKRIQFYTSDDITIQRKVNNSSGEIISGKIRFVNGEEIEEVVIKRGTPGVAVWFPDQKRFGISFEDGDDQYLTFGPNPERKGRYFLLASDWKNKIGTVHYQGQKYYTSPSSSYVYLLVDMKKINKMNKDSRVAKGRTIN